MASWRSRPDSGSPPRCGWRSRKHESAASVGAHMTIGIEALPGVAPDLLGESPLWHPGEGVLYWCDIPGRRLHRYDPHGDRHRQWDLDAEPGCIVPLAAGALLMPCRDGLWRFDVNQGRRERVAPPPYD